MKTIAVPLRNFALPSPRTGSIEARSSDGRAAAEGREIHLRVQKRRAKSDPSYRAEAPVSGLFLREEYRFRVDGRIDGLFAGEPPRIEEIKSSSGIRELALVLAEHPFSHPYSLQLLTYGYLWWREHAVVPELSFHLVSTRGGDSLDLSICLDIPHYEEWLDRRLAELAAEAAEGEKRAARRRKTAAGLTFPFAAPRPGQVELMETIEEGMAAGSPMLLQAPTGLGKTVGVLFPALREALGRGEKVVYVTPKNSQHPVAEDAAQRIRDAGAAVRSLSVTAKGKICFMDEPLCTPECCEFARDYYDKLREHGILEILARKRKLTSKSFRKLGEKFRVCPFELQLESARDADVVICDYNYVFAPRSASARLADSGIGQEGKPNLVIDEIHNLPARAMENYSPTLPAELLEGMREEFLALPPRWRSEAEEILQACLRVIASCGEGSHRKPAKIAPPLEAFREEDGKIRALLNRYLESDPEPEGSDAVMRLSWCWSGFTEALELAADPERDEFFVTWHPGPAGGTLKVTCCDASAMLRECYGDYRQVVGFSATLKPFDYYAKLSGLEPERVRTAEFASPFPRERRKLLIIPQVSTRYADRERNYARVAEAVSRITAVRPGNYLVFLPSFEFLERVAALFPEPAGWSVVKQERGMGLPEVEAILARLAAGETPTVVFAVQGGSLSEGVDYPGEAIIGAFVVGPPLPAYDLEREETKTYYQRRYGAGFEYAYTIPAMARAVQAAGRVIRSETDRGIIVLMDARFMEPGYSSAMPIDWFDADPAELVSGSILSDVAAFWAGEEEEGAGLTDKVSGL